jgi:hypothetical protein
MYRFALALVFKKKIERLRHIIFYWLLGFLLIGLEKG